MKIKMECQKCRKVFSRAEFVVSVNIPIAAATLAGVVQTAVAMSRNFGCILSAEHYCLVEVTK